jgi:uncharacterized protein YbaR (Trm112 family)
MKYQKKKQNKFCPMNLKKFFNRNLTKQKYSKQLFDRNLLKYLKCPYGEIELIYDEEKNYLVSNSIQFAFPIKNGVPCFTEDEMISLDKKTYKNATIEENDF